MMIYKKSSKGGVAIGSNSISRETLGGMGLSLLALAALGLISLIKPKKKAVRVQDKKKKKAKSLLNLAAILPIAYKLGKGAARKAAIDKFKAQFEEGINQAADELGVEREDGSLPIEVEYAIPIGSEEDVYEYIKENQV